MLNLDFQDLLASFKKFLKENLLIVIIFSSGLLLFLMGLGFLAARGGKNTQEVLIEGKTDAEIPGKNTVVVDVEGAVILPGVYKLSAAARVQDALISAGGLSQKADRDYVAKYVNLAKPVLDSEKIYIPFVRENAAGQGGGIIPSAQKLIDINTAGQTELDNLPGVGGATAQKIINGRPYNSINELISKNIISKSSFDKIKEKITVY